MSRILVFVISFLFLLLAPVCAQDNTVTFVNQSGELALVKLIGPTNLQVEVPSGEKAMMKTSAGRYIFKVRYGKEGTFHYAIGEEFEVTEIATTQTMIIITLHKSMIIITLHKVEENNYQLIPISEAEFNKTEPPLNETHTQKETKVPSENRSDLDIELISASSRGDKSQVEALIKKGANVNAEDQYNATPLHHAAAGGHKEVVKLLLEKGAKINAKDTNGFTPLIRAVVENRSEILNMLLEAKAQIDAKDNQGQTALARAVQRDRQAMVWIASGIRAPDKIGPSRKEAAAILLAKGADVNAKDNSGRTVLTKAVIDDQEEIVKLLLKSGAKVDLRGGYEETALYEAALNNRLSQASILLDNKANPNIQTKYGDTPLIRASQEGHLDMVKLLLARGARVDIRDKQDKTALMYAEENGHKEVVNLLRNHQSR